MEVLKNKWFGAMIVVAILASTSYYFSTTQDIKNPLPRPEENSENSGMVNLPAVPETSSVKIKGVILPHHLLVENYIDEVYQQISSPDIKRIILISPNHFLYGRSYIQSTEDTKLYDGIDLDLDYIKNLEEKTPLEAEITDFKKEHGIYNHLMYIDGYFPNAKVVPIIIKGKTPQKILDPLVTEILKNYSEDTLIIISVDFSHYTDEKIALDNDNKIIAWLSKIIPNKDAKKENIFKEANSLAIRINKPTEDYPVGIDSPESVYVFVELMRNLGATKFNFIRRTSSADLLKIADPKQNTSHIFATVE